MSHSTKQYIISKLSDYLNRIAIEEDPHSIDDYHPISLSNWYYASILLDVYFGNEPSYEEVEGMGFRNTDEAYQNAVYLYNKWLTCGLRGAVADYCKIMDSKRKGQSSNQIALRDGYDGYSHHQLDILTFMRNLVTKTKKETF